MYVCAICLSVSRISQNVVDKFLRIFSKDGMSQQQQILVVMWMMNHIQE